MVIGASTVGRMIAPATAMWKPQNQNKNQFGTAAKTPQVPQVKVPQANAQAVQKSGGFKPLTMNQLYHDETIGNRVDIIL